MHATIRIFRTGSHGPLFYGITGDTPSPLTRGLLGSRKFFANPSPKASLQNVLLQVSQRDESITFVHPKDMDSTDIRSVIEDATYEYRSAAIGHASIVAACLWSAWAMPSGGWFVLLFKQVALPLFAGYGSVRFIETHFIANGAERLDTLLKNGDIDFKLDTHR